MKRRPLLVAGCCLAWAAAIFATSSTVITPQTFFDGLHENVFRSDDLFRRFQIFWGVSWFVVVKGWHVLEFTILMSLGTWAIDLFTTRPYRSNVLSAAVLCLAYAAADEWHQTFVPDRGGVFSDVMIDALGVLLAGVFLYRGRHGAVL